jgi:hypothetical protein
MGMLVVAALGFVGLMVIVFVVTAQFSIKGDPLVFGQPSVKIGPFEVRYLPWRALPVTTVVLGVGYYLCVRYAEYWPLMERIVLGTIVIGSIAVIFITLRLRWDGLRREKLSRSQWVVAPPPPHAREFDPTQKTLPRPPEKSP